MAVDTSSQSHIVTCPLGDVCSPNKSHSVQPDIILSDAAYRDIRLIIGGFVTTVLSLCGLVTNVINVLVFHRQGLRDRMNLCLFSLALSDLTFLTCTAVFSFVNILTDLQLLGFGDEQYLKAVTYALGTIYAMRCTSSFYIMIIAIERCLCVTFPLRAVSLIKTQTMAVMLVVFAILPQLGYIVQPLRYHVVSTMVAGKLTWRLVSTEIYLHNKDVIDALFNTIFSVSVPIATFLLVSIATFITVVQLNSAMAWREKTSSVNVDSRGQQRALTMMLVVASCVYIGSMIPFVAITAARVFVTDFSPLGLYANMYMAGNIISNVFPRINSSVNFFVYFSRSSRYRCELRALCISKKGSLLDVEKSATLQSSIGYPSKAAGQK
ncbi:uncharacterized protein LOC112566909 [Pomacea canaliculata]|uniref:uncharacterized protein LOC112566909 n=1 Tax=Pomacea canaliculata TaxID=400727 RepID=UPI000D726D4C|nr:uncharacterized protein LOC112566909 [Pomacea canaliculata]